VASVEAGAENGKADERGAQTVKERDAGMGCWVWLNLLQITGFGEHLAVFFAI
jgi:hypothetical protein